ncbi:MAG: hydroxymethylbilane synthase [Caldilineaceae bacterium]
MKTSVILGTRTSELALWQTNHIIAQLQAAWPTLQCKLEPFVTQGDRTQAQGKPLPAIGGKGLFTAELEEALRTAAIDLAVHSLKDLPVEDSPGLTLGAITSRADVRDALVARAGWTLATLPQGAVVGTSSTRRAAQLLAARPDLIIRSIRGNVGTRVRKVMAGEYDATVLAVAGLERLGLLDQASEILPLPIMLPAPGQGALAVQCRADDEATLALLAAINDSRVRAAVDAERAFLHELGGGCSAPVAAYAQPVPNTDALTLDALVGAADGQHMIRIVIDGQDETIGVEAARQALAQGAALLLTQSAAFVSQPPQTQSPHSSTTNQPLAGKRIVVTRAQEQADDFAAKLAQQGAEPILAASIRIVRLSDLSTLDQALRNLASYQWLIFTSVNGVAILGERLRALGVDPAATTMPKVAAVGAVTAQALRRYGLAPAFVPATYVAEAIVDGLGEVAGTRILLPQAALARETLAERFTARGAQVDAIPIYDTLPAPLAPAVVATLRQGVDALTFTSGSTVESFVSGLADHPGLDSLLQQATIACIGPQTAAKAQALGLQVDLVAAEHTIDGLIQGLCAYYRQSAAATVFEH